MELDINLLKLLTKLKIVDYVEEHEYGAWRWYWHYYPRTEIVPYMYFCESYYFWPALKAVLKRK